MRHTRLFAFVLPLALLACTAGPSDDGAESAEDGYTITPKGSSGELQATVPPGAMAAQILARRKDGTGPVLTLTAGGAARPVSPGAYCVWSRVTGSNVYDVLFDTQPDCSVSVATGARTTYRFGAVSFAKSRDELLYGLDVGGTVNDLADQAVRRMLTSKQPVPHAVGSFEYGYVSMPDGYGTYRTVALDSYAFTIAADATTPIDLLDTTGRAGLRILPAAPRGLPNATARIDATVGWDATRVVNAWFDLGSLPKPLVIRAKSGGTLRTTAPTPQTVTLTQPMTDKQLARLDVEDVAVTMPDGSVKAARGTVKIGAFTFPTNAGIDLLPGTYAVTVTYQHPADNSTITETFNPDVQP